MFRTTVKIVIEKKIKTLIRCPSANKINYYNGRGGGKEKKRIKTKQTNKKIQKKLQNKSKHKNKKCFS